MSGEITLSGLGSGIDFSEITTKLVEAEKYQANKLETWKKTWQKKIDSLDELNTNIAAIRTANDSLRIRESFVSRIASNSVSSVADIAVDSTVPLGSYKLEVASSVKHKLASKGVTDENSVISTQDGTVEFSDGEGHNVVVNITDGMTMSQFKTAVDSQLSAVNSNAELEYANNGSSSNSLRLQLTSSVSGSSGEITFTHDDSNLKFNQTSYDDDFEAVTGSSFSIIDPAGTYTGNTNKRMQFKILDSGTVGSGNIRVQWTDLTDNKSGTITVNGTGEFAVTQGFKLNVGAGSLTKNDVFAIDLNNPDIQKAQDTGLAQSARITHQGLSSSTSSVSSVAGTFTYSYSGNENPTLQIPANTTLDGLAKIINEDSHNPGVIASVVNDGLGTAQSYHLVLTGKSSGASNQISVSNSTLSNMSTSQFQTTREATNAMIKIDDYPSESDSWIQKSNNLVSDLIPGSSVTLKTSGTTLFSINNDSAAMADKVQDFVDAYNASLDYIDDITKVVLDEEGEADTEEGGILVGNYAVNMVKSNLKTFIGERANGFDSDSENLSLLTQVGLSTGDDKRLAFDRDAFITQLNTNPDQVINLFSADNVGSTDNSIFTYSSGLSTTKAGSYEIESTFDDGELSFVRYRKAGTDTWYTSTNNKQIKISTDKSYFTIFEGDARGVMIQTANGGTGSQSTTLNIKEGKAKTFETSMDALFDDKTGITKVLTNNYESIIKNIDKRIDREELRLEQVKSRLEERFARLETNMTELNGQMTRLQSQISSLPSTS